ncbi:hypothetical protein CY34DRAFT_800974 [Suillus luteus UH-Slu-Lm8-n1]|uniref:Uncharacterized protein n=1 Tax=Suillus luteus UH-Slu-Lm8-n1 TaxID=930992 RepID=A0A0D0BJ56_9AGAM|nr:hypothetical protein CY34DRAFT_800974 [Suillus luteus UH-Slu-Lm8-n1]
MIARRWPVEVSYVTTPGLVSVTSSSARSCLSSADQFQSFKYGDNRSWEQAIHSGEGNTTTIIMHKGQSGHNEQTRF